MMDFNIITECYVDTKLVKIIVPPAKQKGYNHQKGWTNVVKVMKEKLHDEFALGIIDKDKKQPQYLESFSMVYCFEECLYLYKHLQKHHYIILIAPAIEEWILQTANSVGIDLQGIGLPNTVDELKKITKTSKSENDDPYSRQLKKLFTDIIQKDAVNAKVLQLWVSYIRDKNYAVQINELITLTDSFKTNI